MQNHIKKAQDNERLIEHLNQSHPEDYFDWKITIVFYTALHYIKAYFKLKKKASGHSHADTAKRIDPKSSNATLPFKLEIFDCYQELYSHARNARYKAYENNNFQLQLMKASFNEAINHLEQIKSYLKSKGLKI